MSLTRKMLKALGLEEDKIEQIIDAHTEVTDALKNQLKDAQGGAESLATITEDRNRLQAKLADMEAKTPDAAKVQADFDAFKAQVEAEKANGQKVALLTDALKGAGVARDDAVKALLKAADMGAAKLVDGKIENADTLIGALKTEYPSFFATVQAGGIPSVTPPAGGKPGTSKEQFTKMTVTERAAIAAKDPQAYAALKGE